jgi:carboxyl-terminal processing protease
MLPDQPDAPRPADDAATSQPDGEPSPPGPPTERRRSPVLAVALVLVAIIGGGALFLSGYSVGRQQSLSPGTPADQVQAWQPFWDIYDAIVNRYALDTPDRSTIIEGAIKGMVDSLGDPYSSYLSPADFQATLQGIAGQFEGIGAEIGTVDANGNTVSCSTFGPDCQLVVVSPIDGSPAAAVGLQPGDIILTVDGKSLDGLTPDQARDEIRGKAGTQVTLHIERGLAPNGAASPAPSREPGATPNVSEFDVTITRAAVQQQEVTTRELAGGSIGYVRLTGFSDAGADQFQAAVKGFVDKGVKKLVIDLRGNPGGFLLDARKVASDFIASGPVFWQEDAQGVQSETDALPGGVATDPSIKVAVLIDGGTASAAEIVAGALQDRGRATLIGQQSFGKGTVQEWLTLDQLGGVKLTVDKWLTPDKRWIHKVGLTPDIPVEIPANVAPGADPVLDKAVEVLSGSAALGAIWKVAA